MTLELKVRKVELELKEIPTMLVEKLQQLQPTQNIGMGHHGLKEQK